MSNKKIAILQSNYIPWKGVFDMINKVDVFVFHEDVQFTKQDWRTRNKIKTVNGSVWLTIPVKKVSVDAKIFEVQIFNDVGNKVFYKKHYNAILEHYSKAPFFKQNKFLLEKIYLEKKWENLSEFNIYTTKLISDFLGIKTEFINSKDLNLGGKKTDKLISICQKLGADHYLSGPSAKNYIEQNKFDAAGIELEYMRYDGYKQYQQLHGDFDDYVSVLDVILNCGDRAAEYIFREK